MMGTMNRRSADAIGAETMGGVAEFDDGVWLDERAARDVTTILTRKIEKADFLEDGMFTAIDGLRDFFSATRSAREALETIHADENGNKMVGLDVIGDMLRAVEDLFTLEKDLTAHVNRADDPGEWR